MNKRSFFLTCLFVLGVLGHLYAAGSDAQNAAPSVVKVRAVRYQNYVRIVLTAEDSLAKSATVIFTKNKTIRVDFRMEGSAAGRTNPVISLDTGNGVVANDMPVEIIKSVSLAVKGNACIITVPNAEDIKVLKLQSPSRIVVDALFTAVPKDIAALGSAALKAVSDQIAFKYFVIDAGHGGYDYGIRGTHFVEKDFVLVFARDLSGMLSKSGKEVVLLRKSDQIMSIYDRADMSNKRPPDILISIHVSSTKAPVIYSMPAIPERTDTSPESAAGKIAEQKKIEMGKGIADAIAKSIEKEFSIGVVRETIPLSLLARSKAPAVLIELPNPDEFNYEKKNRERFLAAIMKGLAAAKEERQSAPALKPEYKPENKDGIKPEKI